MGGVFVTVGTTSFDALVATVDSAPFAALLHEQGFTELTVQYGKHAHTPSSTVAATWQ
jgi:beta-1,4-N-acetylglucosaminyltransferase